MNYLRATRGRTEARPSDSGSDEAGGSAGASSSNDNGRGRRARARREMAEAVPREGTRPTMGELRNPSWSSAVTLHAKH